LSGIGCRVKPDRPADRADPTRIAALLAAAPRAGVTSHRRRLALGLAHKSAAFPRELSGGLLRFADRMVYIESDALTREERANSDLYQRRRT